MTCPPVSPYPSLSDAWLRYLSDNQWLALARSFQQLKQSSEKSAFPTRLKFGTRGKYRVCTHTPPTIYCPYRVPWGSFLQISILASISDLGIAATIVFILCMHMSLPGYGFICVNCWEYLYLKGQKEPIIDIHEIIDWAGTQGVVSGTDHISWI